MNYIENIEHTQPALAAVRETLKQRYAGASHGSRERAYAKLRAVTTQMLRDAAVVGKVAAE